MKRFLLSRLARVEERFGTRAEPRAIVIELVEAGGRVTKRLISWVGGPPRDAAEREKEILLNYEVANGNPSAETES